MDGILDIIIAVLFIAVPAIFKAIGNKLEKSGKAEKAGRFKKVADVFKDEGDESTIEGWILEKMGQPVPEVIMTETLPEVATENVVSQVKTTERPKAVKPMNKKPAILVEDEPKKKGEKIDPKKLVIYSEIMKPKF